MSAHVKSQAPDRADKGPSNSRRMNVILRWWQSAVENWQRRKMIAALEALDDRTLLDIGLHRGDIKRVVDDFDDAELGMAPVPPEQKSHDISYAGFRRAA
ncbi:hypothetical protein MASR2M74_11760 [Paracoccaceae bacterium]